MASRSARRPDRWYYFAYGSNMSLKQMAERCPSSLFMGKGRIDGYRWQINQRGVANVVECWGDYVEGLVYQIDAKDKRQLDRSEGVALGFYNDEHLHTQFLPLPNCGIKTFHVAKELETDDQPDLRKPEHQPSAPGPKRSNVSESTFVDQNPSHQPASRHPRQESLEMVEALVYVSREYKDDGLIRSEYITRMEKAIIDGRKMGLSDQFLNHVDRTIHRELPRLNNDDFRTRHGPYARMEIGGTSHQPYGVLESTRPRQEQDERVSTIRPSYPRYVRVITARPRYQDLHDLDGNLRYADGRPYRPTYDTGRQSETQEWGRGRSPTRFMRSRGWDERGYTESTTLINSRYHVGGYPEQVFEYRRRGSSTPY
jgi:gamma-glutamylcyclotransferase (GGCT)/AIG2-like uncharacterized protein YtfP